MYPLFDAKRVDISIGDFPSEESIGVLSMNAMKEKTQNQNNEETKISHSVLLHWRKREQPQLGSLSLRTLSIFRWERRWIKYTEENLGYGG